jgi:hypothetical protein
VKQNGEDLFKGLDQVAWNEVQHAYGSATDVPNLLRALVSENKNTRADAWHELYGNLWHQGTTYEATAFAVPFFIRLLRANQLSDKAEVLAYLAALFNGKGYWEVHGKRSRLDKPAPAELERLLVQEKSWVETTRSAIRSGRKTYFRLLNSADLRTQKASAYLLGLIGETNLEVIEEILKEKGL